MGRIPFFPPVSAAGPDPNRRVLAPSGQGLITLPYGMTPCPMEVPRIGGLQRPHTLVNQILYAADSQSGYIHEVARVQQNPKQRRLLIPIPRFDWGVIDDRDT